MENLKDFCADARPPENRQYYLLGYEAAIKDVETKQSEAKRPTGTVLAALISFPLMPPFLGNCYQTVFSVR